jgi:hypothetical protein
MVRDQNKARCMSPKRYHVQECSLKVVYEYMFVRFGHSSIFQHIFHILTQSTLKATSSSLEGQVALQVD